MINLEESSDSSSKEQDRQYAGLETFLARKIPLASPKETFKDDTCDKRNRLYNFNFVAVDIPFPEDRYISVSQQQSKYWLLSFSIEESKVYSNVYGKDTKELPTSLSHFLEIL